MKYITGLKILFFLIFSLAISHNARSQSLNKVIEFADIQFVSGNFNAALIEYQRAMFFSPPGNQSYLFRQTANCYYSTGDYENAMAYYDHAYNNYEIDSLKLECLFQKSSCFILQKNFNFALVELYSIGENISEYFNQKKQFYQAVCYFGLEKFEESFNSFINSVPKGNEEIQLRLTELFDDKKRLFRPNPKTALILSIIIPGAGQFYGGDIKNGINSFVLCGTILGIGFNIASKYGFLNAAISVLPWYQRYYQGGFNRAQIIAEQKRLINRSKYYKEILEIISSEVE